MRELGKAGFLHGVDGARCAARLIGAHLVEGGHVDDVEDVFFLTYAELDAGIDGPRQGRGGLVIDTGGAMSHGAIVARELRVPCVIYTVTGTRDIPDGAEITVDGRTGTVRL